MPNSFAERYRAAMRETGGCPIEAGLLGRLADHECAHGRLPGDRTPKCGCWPQENAHRHRHHPAGPDRRKPRGRPPDRRWPARPCTAARSATAPPGSRASGSMCARHWRLVPAELNRALASVARRRRRRHPRAPRRRASVHPRRPRELRARPRSEPAAMVRRFLAGYRRPNHITGESWDEEDVTRSSG